MELENEIEIFHGSATPTATRIFLQRSATAEVPDALSAEITGPYCRYARTLPTTIPLRPSAGRSDRLEALFPDLCFWTTETPHWYRIRVRRKAADGTVEEIERLWSARQLKAVRGQLYWGEDPARLCVVRASGEWPRELLPWREYDAMMLVDAPSDALCREASEVGVALCARLAACTPDGAWRDQDSLLAEAQRLGRWPAVAILFVEQASLLDEALLARVPNTLIAVRSSEDSLPHDALAHVVLCPVETFHDQRAELESRGRPILVIQSRQEPTLPDSRDACETLLDTLGGSRCLAGAVLW